MSDLPIAFRPATADDMGFILKTYSEELHKLPHLAPIKNNIFFPSTRNLLSSLLEKSTATMVCLDDDYNKFCGYLIGHSFNNDNFILHWAHVKGIYRRMGIFKELLNYVEPNYKNKNIVCSHYFKLYSKLEKKYNLVLDPTILGEI